MRKFISKMKKYRVKNLFLIVVLVLFLVTIVSSYSTTYAKYSTSATGSGTIEAASWVFTLNNQTDATQSITLVSTNDNEKVVPDSSGTISLVIDYSQIETSFTYSVVLGDTDNLPEHLVIYTDDSYTTPLTTLTKTIQVVDFDSSYQETITLYWKWADYDDADGETYDNKWMNQNISVDITVSAEQYLGY